MGNISAKPNPRTRVDYVKQNLVKIPKELQNFTQLKSLNVAGNQIQKYPKWLTKNTTLTYLNCTYNSLETLPPAVFKLFSLEQLDAGFNSIKTISTSIGALNALTRLDLRHNDLNCLPTSVNSLINLETLVLLNNNLVTLPILSGLQNLLHLHLDANMIVEISEKTFEGLSSLERLILSYNQIENLPKLLLNDLSNLKRFEINGNNLKTIGKGFQRLKKLKMFEADGNELVGIDQEVFQLPKLEKLSLSNNNLKELCDGQVEDLTESLIELKLSNNKFTSIPVLVTNLKNLKCLNLEGNNISEIYSRHIDKLTQLEELNVSKNDLHFMGDDLFNYLTNLKKLLIHENKLRLLPNSIDRLKKLKFLFLRSNLLAYLPNSIYKCINLETLCISRNFLYSIPRGIHTLTNLKTLSLEDNRLEALPDSLRYLTNLEVLNLSLNRFTIFPKIICQIKNLKVLTLAHNKINYIPNSLIRLQQLVEIDLNSNKIVSFPRSLGFFPTLCNLSLAGNRIARIPQKFFELNNYTRFGGYQIDFSHNKLKKMGEIWAKLLGLTDELDLSHNNIQKVLIRTFEKTSQVGSLKLSYNKISKLNLVQLGLAQYLKQLHIEGNAYEVKFKKLLQNMKQVARKKKGLNSDSIANFNYVVADQSREREKNQTFKCLDFRHLIELLVDPLAGNTIGRRISVASNRFSIGYSQTRGKRDQMEDALLIRANLFKNVDLIGLFDGHGGRFTSMLAADRLPRMIKKGLIQVFKQLKLLNKQKGVQNNNKKNNNKNNKNNKNNNNQTIKGKDFQKNTENYLKIEIPKLLKNVFLSLNENRKKVTDDDSGSTASLILIIGNLIFSANLGDVKALLLRDNNQIEELTYDHKPTDITEKKRILKLGGVVTVNGSINASLAVSRAFGDFDFHPFVSCVPFTKVVELKETDQKIIIATSSFWELFTEKEVFNLISKKKDPFKASFHLRTLASSLSNSENLSIIVINLSRKIDENSQNLLEIRTKKRKKEQENEELAKKLKMKDKKIDFEKYVLNERERIKNKSVSKIKVKPLKSIQKKQIEEKQLNGGEEKSEDKSGSKTKSEDRRGKLDKLGIGEKHRDTNLPNESIFYSQPSLLHTSSEEMLKVNISPMGDIMNYRHNNQRNSVISGIEFWKKSEIKQRRRSLGTRFLNVQTEKDIQKLKLKINQTVIIESESSSTSSSESLYLENSDDEKKEKIEKIEKNENEKQEQNSEEANI
ncbi:hypothetical protein M0812_01251 [Anaeramoeba flamelloides]|uniref:PPM-type phosphatase domain-containing protein n=1 Tax=Anaeramoeba flamelloides TaxID=1746091 RepID=A0AAV8A4T7_9EUKA|nr:hypothetical protein M0812_01251 [Anaeramoeba flamelloides]